MALINCPNCNEVISDKAKNYIHCRYILVEEKQRVCVECGTKLNNNEVVCSNCGCPVNSEVLSEEHINRPQQVEADNVKIKFQFIKKILLITGVSIVVLVAAVYGVFEIRRQYNNREIEKLNTEYEEKFKDIIFAMLSGAVDAETCGNFIKSVWYNSIYEKEDPATDKFTRNSSGFNSFYDDFNDALYNLFIDTDFKLKISRLKENQNTVADLMKKMKEPPEEWEAAYKALQDYYDAYLTLTNMVINPTGSLTTFSNNFNTADMEIANHIDKVELYHD